MVESVMERRAVEEIEACIGGDTRMCEERATKQGRKERRKEGAPRLQKFVAIDR